MARAKRHYIPGHVWHITHRCHKREYLFKFKKDRNRWMWWLFEAKKKYGLVILDYIVTSNHIHLLVHDNAGRKVIPKSIQLLAGRTGQEYNQRKNRHGAFWQDRYHATAIETGEHLLQCIVYIDLNMVRTGIVLHPSEWIWSGYNEIQKPRSKYVLIDYDKLSDLVGFDKFETFQIKHGEWISLFLNNGICAREKKWSESIAVGNESFITETKTQLGYKARGRRISKAGADTYQIREAHTLYNAHFNDQKDDICSKNVYKWNVFNEKSI